MSPGTYRSDKFFNNTGVDIVHLKCDCINGSIVKGSLEPFLYSFDFSSPPGYKIFKEPRIKFSEKVNESVLSHTTFYLEEDDHKMADFHPEKINFICQSNKI